MKYVYTLKLDNGVKTDIFADSSLELKVNDTCVFRKNFYQDSGVITRVGMEYDKSKFSEEIGEGIRKANMHDKSCISENQMRNKSAIRTAQKFVDDLKLEMKLLNGHYTLDGKQLTIQFTADGRVDFRELVKELSKALGTRIELRQIGVRDESAIYGGIFICGQELCCSKFLKSFDSINVKMAKEQDLSLTPSNISGVCGRLKCCLKYEHDGYIEMEKTMPRRGELCTTPDGKGKVTDRNLLTQSVTIQFEGGNTKRYQVSEIKFNNRNKKLKNPEFEENLEELKKLED
ncbi:MAG: stage 0 sporulation protein [Lentisphaeria bacterium]|nr:stage 0 sporulation protein [Lentisphaeria bacterium]MBR7127742.1 stage 0 sporulation protein [Lentisphaeria bacterium]